MSPQPPAPNRARQQAGSASYLIAFAGRATGVPGIYGLGSKSRTRFATLSQAKATRWRFMATRRDPLARRSWFGAAGGVRNMNETGGRRASVILRPYGRDATSVP